MCKSKAAVDPASATAKADGAPSMLALSSAGAIPRHSVAYFAGTTNE
jgi:hypothetical protein